MRKTLLSLLIIASINPCLAKYSGGTRFIFAYTDSGYGDPLNWSGTGPPTAPDYTTGSTYVPNIQLTVCEPAPTTVNISGYVKTAEGVRIKGAIVYASTGPNTISDALGHYSLTHPYHPSSYVTVTATQTDWSFNARLVPLSSDSTDQNLTGTYNAAYGGGSGTSVAPYVISNATQLNAIGAKANDWNKYFKLTADINLSNYDGLNGRPSFNRIGYYINGVANKPFIGNFDGADHTISNFTFDSNTSTDSVGLFGYVNSTAAQIKNIKLASVDVNSTATAEGISGLVGFINQGTISGCSVFGGRVQGGSNVGGLAGLLLQATISKCSAEVNVSGNSDIGGLIGDTGGNISDCNASCNISGTSTCGGLIGTISTYNGSVTRCSSSGIVSVSASGRWAGGLIGENFGTVSLCYSTASVIGPSAAEIGGLVGRNLENISDSYARGNVTGSSLTGGLVGTNVKTPSSTGSINRCYSTGASTGGGLIGDNVDGVITNSFWDTNSSGKSTSDGGTGKTTVEMQTLSTFADAGWDFINEAVNGEEDIWYIPTGDYPRLCWEAGIKYGGGTGEPNNPYLIFTAWQMNKIGLDTNDWSKCFKLMADIDLSAYTGQQYNIIGYGSLRGGNPVFKGTFDGNWHTISNFNYNTSGSINYIGIFGSVSGRIKNLGLISPTITHSGATNYTGPLTGRLEGGTLACCWVDGGGIAGTDKVGGLAGYGEYGSIVNCWSTAEVSGTNNIGGLVGRHDGIMLTECYAQGNVTGNNMVGGLAGYAYGALENCYSSGAVFGDTNVGGLVGGTTTDPNYLSTAGMFWDVESSGQSTSAAGEGKTTEQMQTMSTFINAGWDFVGELDNGPSDDWAEPNGGGYPVMWYQLDPWPELPGFAAGSGTEGDPYEISTELELRSIGHNPRLMDKHYLLTTDLILANKNFPIIGNWTYPFIGSFDGNNHTVTNLCYKSPLWTAYTGMFGHVGGELLKQSGIHVEIKNLRLRNPQIEPVYIESSGALIGTSGSGTEVINCHVKDANVSATRILSLTGVGGLIGRAGYSSIKQCSSTGKILCNPYSGFVGGLIGYSIFKNDITDCYSAGDVNTGNGDIGGLIGRHYGTVMRCYSSATVSSTGTKGGLIGSSSSTYCVYRASFCDSNVNPGMPPIGDTNDGNVLALPTKQMYMQSTFTDAGWDFVGETINGTNDIWTINEGIDYPCFAWEVYCTASASGDCYEHIGSVQVGSIDNVTGCSTGGYGDYTSLSTTMEKGTGYPIIVTNGDPYEGDKCGIWIDWNQDLDFDDAGEVISVIDDPAGSVFTATITPPATAKSGDTRMRIRIVWNEPPLPCGEADWGETEDYTITVEAAQSEEISVQINLSSLWMYQNLPDQNKSRITANAGITSDPLGNSTYSYQWEIETPNDVNVPPVTVSGGGPTDVNWTFAAPGINQPGGLSDSGQTFKVKVRIVGNDFGNSGTAEREFAIALLGDVDNNKKVDVADRAIINAFWLTGAAGPFTLKDCDLNCNNNVSTDDRAIANAIWLGALGRNSVSAKCPLR